MGPQRKEYFLLLHRSGDLLLGRRVGKALMFGSWGEVGGKGEGIPGGDDSLWSKAPRQGNASLFRDRARAWGT